MNKSFWLIEIILFFLLYFLETSFFTTWFIPIASMPLIFAATIFGMQYLRRPEMGWWLIAKGGLNDFFGIGFLPYEFILSLLLVFLLFFLNRYLFSPSSFYGTIGCVLLSIICFNLFSIIILLFLFSSSLSNIPWSFICGFFLWHHFMLLFLVFFMLFSYKWFKRI
ncbi:hypothetical protein CO172_00225 [Candidatus Uhrbacteria bacterium CG_4_9_14_3_um_filter_36_7]|uniref:Rod shape-determining protein MreD n=1 Tax=Candidatus Uhrbacteria bacterium CG_4_9_14_3_um_filter_36_7 TaxID=1975033 RepID=A0A2M7XIX2_9BACT|nr:MAG: hypothetical protein CO172_00225 [Candidatus Uhrbacteria bacterium CG_4_9_14_3_um_filter_36_7]